jgi:predicted amidohydrolase
LICYDLRFPVWSKNTYKADQYEYDLLIYLANWPDARRHVWTTLLTARALENSAYCLGVNRVGSDGNGLSYAGDSGMVDFKGLSVSETTERQEGIVCVTLSHAGLTDFRQKFNVGPDWDEFRITL